MGAHSQDTIVAALSAANPDKGYILMVCAGVNNMHISELAGPNVDYMYTDDAVALDGSDSGERKTFFYRPIFVAAVEQAIGTMRRGADSGTIRSISTLDEVIAGRNKQFMYTFATCIGNWITHNRTLVGAQQSYANTISIIQGIIEQSAGNFAGYTRDRRGRIFGPVARKRWVHHEPLYKMFPTQ